MIKSHFLSMLLPADTTQHTGKNLQQLKTCNSPCKTQPAAAPSNFAGGGGGGAERDIKDLQHPNSDHLPLSQPHGMPMHRRRHTDSQASSTHPPARQAHF